MKTKWIMAAVAAATIGFAAAAGAGPAHAANHASCDGCHGANGQGKGNVPKIAGMAKDAFIAKMTAFKTGAVKNPVKNAIAKNLSDADIAELADYYASK